MAELRLRFYTTGTGDRLAIEVLMVLYPHMVPYLVGQTADLPSKIFGRSAKVLLFMNTHG